MFLYASPDFDDAVPLDDGWEEQSAPEEMEVFCSWDAAPESLAPLAQWQEELDGTVRERALDPGEPLFVLMSGPEEDLSHDESPFECPDCAPAAGAVHFHGPHRARSPLYSS